MGLINVSALRVSIDYFPDVRPKGQFVLLAGVGSWSMADHAMAFIGKAACPVCEGKPLGRKSYCLGCDRSGLDGVIAMPGLAIDQVPDPEWSAERERSKVKIRRLRRSRPQKRA